MPSFFGKSHLYRYNIQGGNKSHYLVFVHLPCLHTQMKHLFSHLSLYPFNRYDQMTIECLMNYQSLTRDCLDYLFQRLQIRDRTLFHCFALSYFNPTNQRSYWLDPDLPMRQQIPKTEKKPNLTFTVLLYPPVPYAIRDEKARLILYEQLFCNFISSVYAIPNSQSASLAAYFLRGSFADQFDVEKNRDLLRLIVNATGQSDEINEKIVEFYNDFHDVDVRSAQDQCVHYLSQTNSYGMIQLEMKNTLNETICVGLNHQGIHSRLLLQHEFKLEACWAYVTSITSNKSRQITMTIKHDPINIRTLIYYTDSTNYNRYCLRLVQLFSNQFRHQSILTLDESKNSLHHGTSVPDLRSDGESCSNDRTPPSASSSTRSSSQSTNAWTGSLPNLTVQLSTESTRKNKNDPYATYAENLNRIDEQETTSPSPKTRRSLPVPYQSPFSTHSLLISNTSSVGLSCSMTKVSHSSISMKNLPKFSSLHHHLSPCFSCECLVDQRQSKDSLRHSTSSVSTITSHNRSLLNSRTFLSSTSVPLEAETISVHDDATTDTWLADFESKMSSNAIYDEFDSIVISRINASVQDGRLQENTRRNRYPDVIPYDDTRVRLIPTKDNLHGYINASHVKVRVENTIYSYIAAESPLQLTVQDFWRMISGSNVHVIVMLLTNDSQLCANYFPRSQHDKCRMDEFEVELISEQNRDDFHIRHLRMKYLHGQRTRTLVHLQYTTWDDAQIPLDTLSFIEFVNVANSFRRHFGETNPCLVHCTAGIGRTGIFILIHVMIQCITFNKRVSVASVLKVMREHRMSLVDRTYSYVFVYRCLIDYLKSSRLI